MAENAIAQRDWHTRAIVRVIQETRTASVDPYRERTWHVGHEQEMVQFGSAGRPVDRSAWWTDFDIDGAHILKAAKVEVIKVLDEIRPD